MYNVSILCVGESNDGIVSLALLLNEIRNKSRNYDYEHSVFTHVPICIRLNLLIINV